MQKERQKESNLPEAIARAREVELFLEQFNVSKYRLKVSIILLGIGNGILAVLLKVCLDLLLIPLVVVIAIGQLLITVWLFYYFYPRIEISTWQNLFEGISYTMIFLLAIFALNESFNPFKIVGIILIIIAVGLI